MIGNVPFNIRYFSFDFLAEQICFYIFAPREHESIKQKNMKKELGYNKFTLGTCLIALSAVALSQYDISAFISGAVLVLCVLAIVCLPRLFNIRRPNTRVTTLLLDWLLLFGALGICSLDTSGNLISHMLYTLAIAFACSDISVWSSHLKDIPSGEEKAPLCFTIPMILVTSISCIAIALSLNSDASIMSVIFIIFNMLMLTLIVLMILSYKKIVSRFRNELVLNTQLDFIASIFIIYDICFRTFESITFTFRILILILLLSDLIIQKLTKK